MTGGVDEFDSIEKGGDEREVVVLGASSRSVF